MIWFFKNLEKCEKENCSFIDWIRLKLRTGFDFLKIFFLKKAFSKQISFFGSFFPLYSNF